MKLIEVRIEKEKAEGMFYANPITKKALEEIKEKAGKCQRVREKCCAGNV